MQYYIDNILDLDKLTPSKGTVCYDGSTGVIYVGDGKEFKSGGEQPTFDHQLTIGYSSFDDEYGYNLGTNNITTGINTHFGDLVPKIPAIVESNYDYFARISVYQDYLNVIFGNEDGNGDTSVIWEYELKIELEGFGEITLPPDNPRSYTMTWKNTTVPITGLTAYLQSQNGNTIGLNIISIQKP